MPSPGAAGGPLLRLAAQPRRHARLAAQRAAARALYRARSRARSSSAPTVLVLYYLHAWLNPCIFDAAFLDLPRVGALLVRRLRGATSLPEAMASGLRSVIAGFS